MMQKRKPKPAPETKPETQPEAPAPVKPLSRDAQNIVAQIRAKIEANPEFTYQDVIAGLKTATTQTKNPMMKAVFQPMVDMLDALSVIYEDMHKPADDDSFTGGMLLGMNIMSQVGAKLIEEFKVKPGQDDKS